MTEGQYITHPDIADGFSCLILRVHCGNVTFELPNTKQQTISINSPRGKELVVSEEPAMIKGLTDNNEGLLPYIGVIRKGGPMHERTKEGRTYKIMGKDLDHFRFTSEDADVTTRFEALFTKEPKEIKIQLPFATTEENFDAWKEAWAASGLVHRCDGETMHRWQRPDGTFCDDPKPCDSHTKPERERCKEIGRLKVFIPELGRMALVTVQTSSKHDIVNIHGALKVLERQCKSLIGIPFVLTRKEADIHPIEGGKRVTRKKWLIHIEPAPEWAMKLLAAQATAALPSAQPLALNAAPDEEDEEPEEIPLTECSPDYVIQGEVESEKLDESYVFQIEVLMKRTGTKLQSILDWAKVSALLDLSQAQADEAIEKLRAKLPKEESAPATAAPLTLNPLAKSVAELVTPKQIVMARAICRDLNLDVDIELQEIMKLNCKIEELSRRACSAFIEHLKDLQDGAPRDDSKNQKPAYADFACAPNFAHEMLALGKEAMTLFKVNDDQVRTGLTRDVNEHFKTAHTSRKQFNDQECNFAIAVLRDRIQTERERQASQTQSAIGGAA